MKLCYQWSMKHCIAWSWHFRYVTFFFSFSFFHHKIHKFPLRMPLVNITFSVPNSTIPPPIIWDGSFFMLITDRSVLHPRPFIILCINEHVPGLGLFSFYFLQKYLDTTLKIEKKLHFQEDIPPHNVYIPRHTLFILSLMFHPRGSAVVPVKRRMSHTVYVLIFVHHNH